MHSRTLFVENSEKLTLENNFIVSGENKVYIGDIDEIIFDSEKASVSLSLINRLVEKNVSLIVCGPKKLPVSLIVPMYGANGSKKVRSQFCWAKDNLDKTWSIIVREKISTQSQLLTLYGMYGDFAEDIAPDDFTNTEGRFASIYFKKLFGRGFVRHREDNINSALNYGYAVLLSRVTQVIASHGYITQIGIHHKGETNRFNLSYDIIEPFRPLIDRIVYIHGDKPLDKDYKSLLISVSEEDVIYRDKKYSLVDGIDKYFLDVMKSVENGMIDVGGIKLFQSQKSF